MSKWMETFLNEKMGVIQYWCSETAIREHFGIKSGVCVDGVALFNTQDYWLVEEKGGSDIRRGIAQLQGTFNIFKAKNLKVTGAVLACTTLRHYSKQFVALKGYLYYKTKGHRKKDKTRRKAVSLKNGPPVRYEMVS